MFLSVVKRTPARVKFWFIKNYMSPQVRCHLRWSGNGTDVRLAELADF
jgi:hypothetical protein